ncbi:TBCC-domain-containing protein [Ceratobasidium sp. AG-I]|nr:TBCC-domain-containing protein [Ceratobasidium sp. AG-I]
MNTTQYNDFLLDFRSRAQRLEDALSQVGGNLQDVEQLSLDVTNLRSAVTEAVATGILPAYDQWLCQQRVAALEESLSKLRSTAKPKSKFSFRSTANARPTPQQPTKPASTPEHDASASSGDRPQVSGTTEITLSGHSHRSLSLADAVGFPPSNTTEAAQSVAITVKGLSNCYVDLTSTAQLGSINAIHVQGLKRTVLYAGVVQGSILLNDCQDCTIIVSAHQFRMHTTTRTNVYLRIASNPVIEKCADIGFGTSPSAFAGGAADNVNDQTDGVPYNVQDFDWMGTSRSPNWSPIGPASFQLPLTVSQDSLESVLGSLLPQLSGA